MTTECQYLSHPLLTIPSREASIDGTDFYRFGDTNQIQDRGEVAIRRQSWDIQLRNLTTH